MALMQVAARDRRATAIDLNGAQQLEQFFFAQDFHAQLPGLRGA